MIAKPGNKTATVPWPDLYVLVAQISYYIKMFAFIIAYLGDISDGLEMNDNICLMFIEEQLKFVYYMYHPAYQSTID